MIPLPWMAKPCEGQAPMKKQAPHLLSFRTHHSEETLLQIEVEEKTNEIPIALAYLPALPVAGRVFTADALHTHVPFFLRVQQLEGDAVLVVKDNQPTLHEHLATYFADPSASFEEAETTDLQRGRKEIRHIKVTCALSDYLQRDWPGVAQVAQLTRTVTTKKT